MNVPSLFRRKYLGLQVLMYSPLLCSHPSLTITTLVMLLGRMEDPGFPQGQAALFTEISSLSLVQESVDGVLGSQLPFQWCLPGEELNNVSVSL